MPGAAPDGLVETRVSDTPARANASGIVDRKSCVTDRRGGENAERDDQE